MKFTEFKKGLSEGKKFPVYIIEGEDAYFRESAVSVLKSALVSEPELNLSVFDGAGLDPDKFSSALYSYPFMSESRLTVVREFYPKADFFKKRLKDFAEHPPEGSVLAVVNEKPSETLKKFTAACTVDCGKADISVIVKWIKAKCLSEGAEAEDAAARLLAEFCLSDMTRVKSETEKLIAFKGKGKTITAEDVKENVSRGTDYKIYEMTEALGKKNPAAALETVKDLLSKGETPQRLIVYMYNYFRRLLHISIANGSLSDKARLLGVKEYAAKKSAEQARLFSKRALKSAVDALADADFCIKSGKAEESEMFWITLFKIMTA